MIIGVDSGGTFTDFVFLDGNNLRVKKVPSTPFSPESAILNTIQAEQSLRPFHLIHGTTVATNALLERKGAITALITTKGCKDVLEIARQTRDELYSLSPASRQPLVPRNLRFEIDERLDWQGNVLRPLILDDLEPIIDTLKSEKVESVAICLLFSFLKPHHEALIAQKLRESGFLVSVSSEISPEFREYERTSTVCANAFVLPVMQRYIDRFSDGLGRLGALNLSVMQSNGGTMLASEAARMAAKTALSGPAGGLVAANAIGIKTGYRRMLTFDMGGTSTDVALVNGALQTVRNGEIAGLPLLTPMMNIHTVGAGGGSMAKIDNAGSLRVGPESAGASPGPVAYGVGDRLTVTDANLFLGRLPASTTLGGGIMMNLVRVQERFKTFGSRLKMSPTESAEGIIQIANAQMARALRHISVEQGHNPAEYALMSFGGSGGLHAVELAELLAIETVIVPRYPGALSAIGLAIADVRRDYFVSHFCIAEDSNNEHVAAKLEGLIKDGRSEFKKENINLKSQKVTKEVEARYKGQSYTLTISYSENLREIASRFHRAHKKKYGYSSPDLPVEITTLNVTISGKHNLEHDIFRSNAPNTQCRPIGNSTLVVNNQSLSVPIYRRDLIARGQKISGYAIVIQNDATTFIPSSWNAVSDEFDNLVLTRG